VTGEIAMLRLGLAGALVAFMSMGVSAQSTTECAAKYKSFMQKMTREEQSKMSGERLADLNRKAQRIYDACQTGHLSDPRSMFESLDRSRN
jgi:hypothetical protein